MHTHPLHLLLSMPHPDPPCSLLPPKSVSTAHPLVFTGALFGMIQSQCCPATTRFRSPCTKSGVHQPLCHPPPPHTHTSSHLAPPDPTLTHLNLLPAPVCSPHPLLFQVRSTRSMRSVQHCLTTTLCSEVQEPPFCPSLAAPGPNLPELGSSLILWSCRRVLRDKGRALLSPRPAEPKPGPAGAGDRPRPVTAGPPPRGPLRRCRSALHAQVSRASPSTQVKGPDIYATSVGPALQTQVSGTSPSGSGQWDQPFIVGSEGPALMSKLWCHCGYWCTWFTLFRLTCFKLTLN